MKLAFCLYRYIKHGGLSRDFMRITQESLQHGHEIHVYTMNWEGEIPPGFHVHQLAVKGLTNHSRCKTFSHLLTQKLAGQNYDLIIGFNRLPGLDVYFAGDVCFVANAQEKHGFIYRLFPRYKIYAALEKSVFKPNSSTKIFALSPRAVRDYQKYYKTDDQRFYLLPPGIAKLQADSADKQIRMQIRQQLRISEQNKLILFVGSSFKNKGLQRALLAIANLPEKIRNTIRFAVVGRDNTKPWIKETQKLGLQSIVHFLGTRDDVNHLMLAADLLLHPAATELAGMVLIEALVAGLPVLATESCGYAFHVQAAHAGIVVPQPYQQHILNQALLTMLTSDEISAWRERGKQYAEKVDLYSLPQQAVKLLEAFYQEKRVGG